MSVTGKARIGNLFLNGDVDLSGFSLTNVTNINALTINNTTPLVKTTLASTPSISTAFDDNSQTFTCNLNVSEEPAAIGHVKASVSSLSDGIKIEVANQDIWSTITATTPVQFNPQTGTISVVTGSTSNTLMAGDDARVLFPVTKIVKQGIAGPGEFTSVAAAMADIPDDPADYNTYLIMVHAGTYYEPPLRVKQSVYIIGQGNQVTYMQFDERAISSPCIDITGTMTCGIFNMTIGMIFQDFSLVPLEGNAAIYSNGGGIYFFKGLLAGACYNFIELHGNVSNPMAPLTAMICNDIQTGLMSGPGTGPVNTQFAISASAPDYVNTFPVRCQIIGSQSHQEFYPLDSYLKASGSGVEIVLQSIIAQNMGFATGSGQALSLSDGAELWVIDSLIRGQDIAVSVLNEGEPPGLHMLNTTIMQSTTYDLLVQHPMARGLVTGTISTAMSSIQSPNVVLNLVESNEEQSGIVMVGRLTLGANVNTMCDVTDLITNQTMGLVSGGALSIVSGLQLKVGPGIGYCLDNVRTYRVSWNEVTVTLNTNSEIYIAVDSNGDLVQSPNRLSLTNYVLLGRVVTSSSNIVMIDRTFQNAKQMENNIDAMLRDVFGSMVISGGDLTVDASWQPAVTAATYYFASNKITTQQLAAGSPFTVVYSNNDSYVYSSGQTIINNTQYNNTTTGLVSLSAGYYTKHRMYVVSDTQETSTQYFLVIGTQQFSTQSACETTMLMYPTYLTHGACLPLFDIVIRQGETAIVELLDVRPKPSFSQSLIAQASAIQHSSLGGLTTGNDHPQYLLRAGTQPMVGPIDMGNNNILNCGTISGINLASHGSRHAPGGVDAIPSGVPITLSLDVNNVNSQGIAGSFAQSDHRHAISVAQDSDVQAISGGTNNTAGSSSKVARADHVHIHGNQTGGSLHAAVTTSTNGFMIAADKSKLNGLSSTLNYTMYGIGSGYGSRYLPGTGYVNSLGDGDVVISSNTTLTRDMHYNNLTINSGITMYPNGYRIFVRGTLTLNGTINRDGDAATFAPYNTNNVGSVLPSGSVGGGAAGGASGNSGTTTASLNAGVAGGQVAAGTQIGGVGGAGGGITGDATRIGGTVRSVPSQPSATDGGFEVIYNVVFASYGRDLSGSMLQGGDGGGGGACRANCNAGAGGGGAGVIVIVARNITGTGNIYARGGNGANAYSINAGGNASGGGGGGGGAIIIISTTDMSTSGITMSVAGGAGGTGLGISGRSGLAGGAGSIVTLLN